MKVNRKIMKDYRKNPEKVREIFETARNTDMERAEVREHLKYLGNDSIRRVIYENSELNSTLVFVFTSTVGISLTLAGLILRDPKATILGGAIASSGASYIALKKLNNYSPDRTYRDARNEALINIQTRTETI